MTCDMYIYYSRAILGSFFDLLAGKVGVEELSGPLGTVSAVNQAVHYGWREVLSLLALLTITSASLTCCPSRRWTAASCCSLPQKALPGGNCRCASRQPSTRQA